MIEVTTKNNPVVSVSISSTNVSSVDIKNTIVERIIYDEHEYYNGDYIITSDIKDQVIKTNGMILSDDITVLKIPIWETSNESGTTFYIGK